MNQQVSNSLPRCQFRFPSGRRCRFPRSGVNSSLCTRHAVEKQRNSDLTELFTLTHDKFQSPAGIHASLSELFTLLAEDRIAPRRAAVLAYISSLLLRTLTTIQQEAADELAAAKKLPPRIIWTGMPRPSHERHEEGNLPHHSALLGEAPVAE